MRRTPVITAPSQNAPGVPRIQPLPGPSPFLEHDLVPAGPRLRRDQLLQVADGVLGAGGPVKESRSGRSPPRYPPVFPQYLPVFPWYPPVPPHHPPGAPWCPPGPPYPPGAPPAPSWCFPGPFPVLPSLPPVLPWCPPVSPQCSPGSPVPPSPPQCFPSAPQSSLWCPHSPLPVPQCPPSTLLVPWHPPGLLPSVLSVPWCPRCPLPGAFPALPRCPPRSRSRSQRILAFHPHLLAQAVVANDFDHGCWGKGGVTGGCSGERRRKGCGGERVTGNG